MIREIEGLRFGKRERGGKLRLSIFGCMEYCVACGIGHYCNVGRLGAGFSVGYGKHHYVSPFNILLNLPNQQPFSPVSPNPLLMHPAIDIPNHDRKITHLPPSFPTDLLLPIVNPPQPHYIPSWLPILNPLSLPPPSEKPSSSAMNPYHIP